ncbi:MAG: hypothetical protein SOH70_04015 [Lentilactobacillus sunkii]|jgi:hypothetical protein|uniref:hypothetical protein n=1 Tax=Lentilactobacillus sunkii TaxID=481719 RepID=UPI002F360B5C
MSEKCKLCGGTGRVYVDLAFGYTVEACPNCNQKYRRRMEKEFGEALSNCTNAHHSEESDAKKQVTQVQNQYLVE